MKYALILLLSSGLYAQSCYTIQLLSTVNNEENHSTLMARSYDESCRLMEIGKALTVRCGCYEEFKDAESLLPKFAAKYKKAYVTTTYKSRFEENKEELKESIVIENEVASEIEKTVGLEKENSNIVVINDTEPLLIVETEKKIEKKEEKKVKKKKKTKSKTVKKRGPANVYSGYDYRRYLDKLEGETGPKFLDYRYRFGAQFSYDIAYINEAEESYFSSHWRRIRVFHKGSFFNEKLFYELEYSFPDDNNYKDMFIGYKDEFKPLNTSYRIKYGNIKIPFSLETYTSSKYITFMERALTDSFAFGRKVGGEVLLSTKVNNSRINFFASLFSNSIDERQDDEVDQPGYSMRLTYAHKFNKTHLFSVGAGYMKQYMNGEDVKYNQAAESELIRENYVSTTVKDVDSSVKTNIEALYINGKYSLQAEYTQATLDAINFKKSKNPSNMLNEYTFDAYYVQGSYFVMGSGRKYKLSNSTIARVRPKIDGAVELAFRYSHIDLNDRDEEGGSQTDYNYGLNWYYNDEIKLMLNYIVAKPNVANEYDGRLQILQARALFAF